MIHHILAAVDSSPRAPRVASVARGLADAFAAELTVLRVVHVPPELPAAAVTPPDGLGPHLVALAAVDLERLLGGTRGVVTPTLLAREGHPVQTILEVAAALAVDLIVVGSHGYHGLDRLLGTTTTKVSNLARCNVFIVHDLAR